MNLHKQHCFPGQVHAGVYQRAAVVIALDGSVKMTYRNPSIDWLPGVAPRVSLLLGEGERYVLPCTTFGEIESRGQGIATFAVVDPQPFEPLRAVLARGAGHQDAARHRRRWRHRRHQGRAVRKNQVSA